MSVQPEGQAISEPACADRVAQNDERFRNILGRSLIYGSPLIAAICALALRRLVTSSTVAIVSQQIILYANFGIAVCGSAAGVALLHGRLWVKISGSLAYGLLSALMYILLFGVFVATRLWPP